MTLGGGGARTYAVYPSCLCRCLGNDPLIDEESNHDINSVAGVLKLYFRGLENPLFPKERFNDLISCVRESPAHDLSTASLIYRLAYIQASKSPPL